MRLLPGLLAIGVSTEAAIPEYGPARGDKCLLPGDDETTKYTMQYSIESENVIKARCAEKPGKCFSRLQFSFLDTLKLYKARLIFQIVI